MNEYPLKTLNSYAKNKRLMKFKKDVGSLIGKAQQIRVMGIELGR